MAIGLTEEHEALADRRQPVGPAVQAGVCERCKDHSVLDHKQVCIIKFGNKTRIIKHYGGIHAGNIGLDFRQDIIQQVVVVYF